MKEVNILKFRLSQTKKEVIGRAWFRYRHCKGAVLGLVLVAVIILSAVFAPWIIPYPKDAGANTNFANRMQPPSLSYLFGTDTVGRDVFSRVVFSFRSALLMTLMVLAISVPFGFILGVIAGYNKGTLLDSVIMRITDIFVSIPPIVMALAIASILEPNLTNSMLAVTVLWWPWYTRIGYGVASSQRTENYIVYAELNGGNVFYILFKEILPNCLGPVLTKVALDICWVIMMGATLSYVGMGEQAPNPALGNMVSSGIAYLPNNWWLVVFPSLAIVFIVFSFNLVGDGISAMFAEEGK